MSLEESNQGKGMNMTGGEGYILLVLLPLEYVIIWDGPGSRY